MTVDLEKAANCYRQSAEQGHSAAQFNLAMMYERGLGVAQDDRQAAVWYAKVAEQGEAKAQFILGRMYDRGLGVEQNDQKSYNFV